MGGNEVSHLKTFGTASPRARKTLPKLSRSDAISGGDRRGSLICHFFTPILEIKKEKRNGADIGLPIVI